MRKEVWIIGGILLIALIAYVFYQEIPKSESQEEIVELNNSVAFVQENISQAKARQIVTLYDKVEINNLQNLKSEELCEINLDKDEIYSDESVSASYVFDESIVGEKVKLSCDQFERFGISGDELISTTIESKTEVGENIDCDYGSVTTPTVYFWFVSSDDLEKDYCVAPLKVLPLDENKGECFSDEKIQAMKDDCSSRDEPFYSIPDANGCETIYCGWQEAQNLCPPEDLLDEKANECEAEENHAAVRYAEEVSGQDFPCAQVRCSQCPDKETLEKEKSSCEEKGGNSEERFDHETGCSFIYCGAPE